MRISGWTIGLGVLLMSLSASAQSSIRIIPQEKLDSLTQIKTIPESGRMHFDQTEIDLGTLSEDDQPKTVTLRWRNDFDTPLVISRITTGCGCTVPSYDAKPVLPGEEGTLTLTYHPKGHPGTILRKCRIYTQKSEKQPTAVVVLRGEVKSSTQPTHNYLHVVGSMLFKQRRISFRASGERQTERIACMNGGDQPLTPQVMPLPQGFTAEFEPKRLNPGEEGDLVIRYDPKQAPATGTQPIKVMFANFGVPPRETSIRIEFEK